MAIDINPEKARRHLEEADLTKRSAGRKSLLKVPGARGIGGRKRLETVYDLRRALLEKLSEDMRTLLLKPVRSKEISDQINSLAREIKGVAVTDPRVTFQKRKTKGARKVPIDHPFAAKFSYVNETGWKAGKKISKDIHAHHIRGLDKYFKAFLQASDEEIAQFHLDAAKNDIYFGNHPKNRIDLHKAHHLGQKRRGYRSADSIHGLIDWKDVSDDDFWELMSESIGKSDTDIMDLMYDPRVAAEGSKITPGSRKVGEGFIRKPVYEFDEYTSLTDPRIQEQIFDMAADDTRALDNILKQPIGDAFWKGKSPGAAIERFVLEHGDELRSDPTKYKHITDAIASGSKQTKETINQWINDIRIAELKRASWGGKKLGAALPVVGAGFAGWGAFDNVKAAAINPTKHNILKAGGSIVETGGELISAGGILAAPATGGVSLGLVPVGEGIALAGSGTDIGATLHEKRKEIKKYASDVFQDKNLPKIRGRSGAKRAISKEQEELYWQSVSSKPWLTR